MKLAKYAFTDKDTELIGTSLVMKISDRMHFFIDDENVSRLSIHGMEVELTEKETARLSLLLDGAAAKIMNLPRG